MEEHRKRLETLLLDAEDFELIAKLAKLLPVIRMAEHRRGVVERVTADKANVMVRWDGRKSPDDLPIRSIESEPAD
jgi:hypothetical protein